jgi:putative radical SAM enzyme (TIGR03279 family)
MSGLIKSTEPDSAAAHAGLLPGDAVLAINGHALRDVIDAQFYGADDDLAFDILRDGQPLRLRAERASGQALGIAFEHPTFDIDIRRCNNLCPFCFVLQNAPRMRRTLYIKDDDYRYSFLFGHFVTLTNLSDEDWARLAEQRLSPLYVSVHATDLETRRKCLRNANAPDVMAQLHWLADHGIEAHTQLVITPGLNDGAQLEKSVRDLATLWPNVLSISVVPVGLTKHHKYGHRPHTPAEATATIDQIEAWQTEFRATLGVNFAYCTDEWYLVAGRSVPPKRAYDGLDLQANGLGMVRDFLDEWRRVKRAELKIVPIPLPVKPSASRDREKNAKLKSSTLPSQFSILNSQFSAATLATGTLFAPTLAKAAKEFTRDTGMQLRVVPIVNERLGATITIAGLLSGDDVIRQLQQDDATMRESALVILPRIMFDHPDGIALDDVSPLDIARAINKPVALADWMGDVVDAFRGTNRLLFAPQADSLDVPIVREGGWAVEKYL